MKHLSLFSLFLGVFLLTVEPIVAQNTANNLEKHVSILASDSLEGRGLGTKGSAKAKAYITNQFAEIGLKAFNDSYLAPFEFRQRIAWINADNIVGYLQNPDAPLKDEFIVIGAHFDHLGFSKNKEGEKTIYAGADDNASGTAGIIEMARKLKALENELNRSIIFIAFDAEESGLIGSTHFVDNPPVPLEKIKAMISLDMIGMYSTHKGIDLKGLGLLVEGAEIAETIADKNNVIIKNKSAELERQTDTAPFGDKGIPAFHAFTGLKSPYHKPEDKYDLLDYEGMEKVVSFLADLTKQMSTAASLTPAKALEKMAKGGTKVFSVSPIVYNGFGIHNYTDEFFVGKRRYNLNVGAHFNYHFNKNFGLNHEVLFDWHGAESAAGNISQYAITSPLCLQIGSDANNQWQRVFVNLGAYYRYNLGGNIGGETINFDNGFSRDEWGFTAGFGIRVMKLQISYSYRRGLTDLTNNGNVYNIQHLYGVTYKF
jgi:aminopeptidase YwaD